MKRLFQLFAVGGCLLLGVSTFVSGQGADDANPDNYDLQIKTFRGPNRLLVQAKSGPLTTTSPNYSELTSASVSASLPGYLVATFSGESLCTGAGWCTLKLRVGGAEMNPVVGTDFAFDSPGDQWESHSVQRISNLLPAGVKIVDVHWAAVGGATFRIDDWLLKIEFWPK